MRDRFLLLAYGVAVVALTFIHAIPILAGGVLLALALAGRRALALGRRTLGAILVFNTVVSVSYVVAATWQGAFPLEYLVRVNLRVFLLVFLGFWLVERVRLVRALAFSPGLARLVVITAGQIQAFRRLATDFRDGFASRCPGRPTLGDRYRFAARVGGHMLDRAVARSTEVVRALRSRGALDD